MALTRWQTINDHIKLDNIEIKVYISLPRPAIFETRYWKSEAPNYPRMTFSTLLSKVPCKHWLLTPEA